MKAGISLARLKTEARSFEAREFWAPRNSLVSYLVRIPQAWDVGGDP